MDLLEYNGIKIKFEEDGAYFLADSTNSDIKREITNIVKKYNIEDVDYTAIEEALKRREKRILISNDVRQFSQNEEINIKVSNNGVQAIATFIKPLFDGKELTQSAILASLIENGIEHGVDFKEINRFLEERDYSKEYILARGREPEPSFDAYIKFHIDTEPKKPLPKILDDGTLDYKSLELFNQVKKGELLAEKVDAVIGKYGVDVFGKEILSRVPEQYVKLPLGDNTIISEDGKKLLAGKNGRVLYQNGIINIYPILILNNGVNSSTGNVKFAGNVIINGTILNGYKVEADGDVEVNGSVEGATIISGSSIFVTKGIQGNENGRIYAKKDINAQFIENTQVFAEEDITASSILHSNVKCGRHLRLIGKRAVIIGGVTTVGGDAFVKDIGAGMSSNTEIRIGIHPKIFDKYDVLTEEIKEKYKRYDKLEKIIIKLSKQDIKELNEDKKKLFLNSLKEKMEIKKRLTILKNNIDIIIPLFIKRIGKLEVQNVIYSGTKVVANNAILFIKEDLEACIIKNFNGKVEIFNK